MPCRYGRRITMTLGCGRRVAIPELALVPVGQISMVALAASSFCDLRRREIPAYGAEILAQLFFVARTHDYV